MGRKPNPLILEFFERGPKLTDNSNRYPHRCRACGENFPKGRIDSLTTHLTKKCPAISAANRVSACLALNGVPQNDLTSIKQEEVDLPVRRNWTPLETLAEVSRQIDLSEKHDQPAQNGPAENHSESFPSPDAAHFAAQEATIDTAATGYDGHAQGDNRVGNLPPEMAQLQAATFERDPITRPNNTLATTSALDVAMAATARLNPALLDPQLVNATIVSPLAAPASEARHEDGSSVAAPERAATQPWGKITDLAHPSTFIDRSPLPSKGGVRMDVKAMAKLKHKRSRFPPVRRREVQEVRKLGACIRCRILRKTCSSGDPCDTCRKVLSPRVWRAGCIRTKLIDHLDLYTAGVQIVLAQNKINSLRGAMSLENNGVQIVASIFPEAGTNISLPAMVAMAPQETTNSPPIVAPGGVVMIDNDSVDVPFRLETYMREILGQLIARENPGSLIRITLDTAEQLLRENEDTLLRRAIDLWGLVEMLDLERQWTIFEAAHGSMDNTRLIKDETDHDIFDMICLQLTAAAERRAGATSKTLMNSMQRVLQDSKTKVGFGIFLTSVILLSCIEKTTWAFKAWEQDNLRQGWPLSDRQPSVFTQQGYVIAEQLRILLGIRKCLPRTALDAKGFLITLENDPAIEQYYARLRLNAELVRAKHENPSFSPTDSKSLSLLFSSVLLLPSSQ